MPPINPCPPSKIKEKVKSAVRTYLEVINEAGDCNDRAELLSKVKERTEEIYAHLSAAASEVAQYRERQTAKNMITEINHRTAIALQGIDNIKSIRMRLQQSDMAELPEDENDLLKRRKIEKTPE